MLLIEQYFPVVYCALFHTVLTGNHVWIETITQCAAVMLCSFLFIPKLPAFGFMCTFNIWLNVSNLALLFCRCVAYL